MRQPAAAAASRGLLTIVVVVATLALAVVPGASAAYVTTLSVKQPDELRKVMLGGECWLVACTDMEDNDIGERLVGQAADTLGGECQVGALKCRKKVSDNVTFAAKSVWFLFVVVAANQCFARRPLPPPPASSDCHARADSDFLSSVRGCPNECGR